MFRYRIMNGSLICVKHCIKEDSGEKNYSTRPGPLSQSKSAEHKKNNKEYEILAFQRTFPHCVKVFGIEPDYWTATDPFAFLEGLQHIVERSENIKTQILVPDVFTTNTANYRLHFGTSPLLRQKDGWETLQRLFKFCKEILQNTDASCNYNKVSFYPKRIARPYIWSRTLL